jgi:SAM-dependent methyltransferase
VGESIVFDRAAGYYDATRGFPAGEEQRVADLFVTAGRLGPASRVLEVGIGTGRIAVPLATRVGRLVGIDLSRPMMERLVGKLGESEGVRAIELVRADAARLPVAAASVDAVTGVHVFHLIPRWREVLAEIARVLRPGAPLLHGGDDHARGEAWGRWRERFEGELGVENVGVPRRKLEIFLDEEGWRKVGEERVRFSRRLRPSAMIDLVGRRTWSMTWRMSEPQLAAAVAALRDDLLAAFGDLDREVEIETGFWVRAYLPPVS